MWLTLSCKLFLKNVACLLRICIESVFQLSLFLTDLRVISFFYSQIGLQGEHLGLYKGDGLGKANWVSTSEPPRKQPLTWYKVKTWIT